ncbi:uncharacterized protein A1O5_06757 [Cladophialophora psammophila CBS 110553]|uniref:Uncharacterized protein n=1 Tax=Cladophialophora psammophila CBS 110553 TaxID=1182543 RepID=W9WYE4_9EURO|nr:uncharacterized protein A1O5_06757 [Cladophialophora psammophila CBS 110553]EXJ69686.1 hypothetical protein A1O5_06757 [Cladophialophora psammophila CBS 110553]
MAAIWRLVGASPAKSPPPAVESDEVYPVHMLDDTQTLRDIVVTWTLCFNDVLDADKLYMSLSRLLEIGDWRKVGGRLRLKENGELEIHVPRPFTAERPAVSYTHQSLAMDIEDHPLAKTLPKATEAPSIQPGPQGFRVFAAREDAPATLEDFVCQDTPQLSLHITSFNDATLVALSWPHTLMDVMGQQALLRGWSLVLAGREAEVPPMLGAREDALCAAADAPVENEEEFRLGQKRLRGWAMLMFGLRFAWDLLWNRVVETRTIFLPKRIVAELRRRAQGDLAAQDSGQEKPFISEGDVLTAWALRAVVFSLPQPRPVSVLHALNARFRLSSLVQASGVYVQNMAVAAFTFRSREVATGSLGAIALENRRQLMEQSTEAQVLACLRELRRESKSGRSDPRMVCGEPDALLMPFTNWTRAGFFETADFSPALVRAGKTGQSRSNPPGSMVFHHAQSMRQSTAVRNVIVVLGKDHGDNYWLTGILLPAAWAKIEEDINRMSQWQ